MDHEIWFMLSTKIEYFASKLIFDTNYYFHSTYFLVEETHLKLNDITLLYAMV